MSNLTLICILLVIVVVSAEVDAHTRESENKDKDGGKHEAKEVTKSGGKHKVVKKCKCRAVLEDKTSVKCKNVENGKTKTKCKKTIWKFGPEQECFSPGSGAGNGEGSGSGSTVGTGTGIGNGDRTTVSSPVTGTVTGGGYDPGTGDSGVVIGEVETPDEIIKMCADGRTGNSPPLFYFPSKSKTHFIQCDANGQSFLMTCGANTEWCQLKLTCDFVGACV